MTDKEVRPIDANKLIKLYEETIFEFKKKYPPDIYEMSDAVKFLKIAIHTIDEQPTITIEPDDHYRWHDLRKDPEDLPKANGLYYTYSEWYEYVPPDSERAVNGYTLTEFVDGRWLGWSVTVKTIAWKEIEPFEVEE